MSVPTSFTERQLLRFADSRWKAVRRPWWLEAEQVEIHRVMTDGTNKSKRPAIGRRRYLGGSSREKQYIFAGH